MLGVPEGHALIWDPSTGRKQDLGSLGGANSTAAAINDAGQVAGTAQLASGEARAFVWDAAGGMRDLGTLAGNYSYATAINAAGQVAGYSSDGSGFERAVVWDPVKGIADLGTLGGQGAYSRAFGINDLGQVVGTSRSDTLGGAFLWDSIAGMTNLNTNAQLPFGEAYAINSFGTVVGMGGGTGTGTAAIIWDALHGPRDLQGLVATVDWDLEAALAVNDLGHIIGYGLRNGSVRGFVAVPVPEPTSFVLLVCGTLLSVSPAIRRRFLVPRFVRKC